MYGLERAAICAQSPVGFRAAVDVIEHHTGSAVGDTPQIFNVDHARRLNALRIMCL
jgi:hypothetical protein